MKNNLNQIKTNKLLKIVRDFIAQYQHQNQFEKASRLKQIMGRGYNQYTGGYSGYSCFGCFGGYNRWNNQGWGGIQPGGGGSGGGTAQPTPDDGIRRQQIQSGVMPYRRPVVVNNPGGGRLETTPTIEVRETREGSSIVERPVQRPGSIAEPQQSRSGGQTRPATSVPQSKTQPVPQREVRPASAPERRPATNTTSPSRSGGSAPSVQQPQRQPSSSPQRSSPSTRRPL